MSLFGYNQTQTQNTGNSLFSNQNTNNNTNSLFGNNNTNQKGLFGNNINQNKNEGGLLGNILNNNNTNNINNNKDGLFGNTQANNNSLFGANNNITNTTNNNTNTLFGAPNTSNSNTGTNTLLGNFQNNNNSNKNDSTSPLFGTKITQTTTQNNQNPNELKKQESNPFSLFNQTKSPEKPKENNTSTNNQNQPGQLGLFQNTSSLFGAPKPEEKKTNENNIVNTQAQTQSQTQNQNKEIEEKKKKEENKSQNTLFGNNINKQAETGKNNLFGDIGNKNEQKQNININDKQNPISNVPNNLNINQNNLNQNQININNQQKNEIKINEINVNKNQYLKIPEKPFDLSLSNSKELEDYEKNQMLYKSNKEILEEFKNMLKTQKEKYKQCVKNTRIFEKKLMGIIDITNANSKLSEINEMKGKLFIEKINGINQRSKNLENIIKNFNDKLDENLIPFKDNIMNSDKFLLNENNSEKFKFYDNFEQISEKCYLIEETLNQAEINFLKREKEMEEKNKKDNNGIWIERNRKKIFVDQNEMNNLFSECYDGLTNLKNMQDNIDKKYEMLKSKLVNNTGNNYINYNYNFNNIY